ncbi:hypothetical protein AG1IA_06223 [Rhizoctonia solani AG-1 IA]|uniref:Uncharacterized protein n=1 Tax=Thanatephorus cucumeris (strain AG1-IA) TaxID=983506 RepID=L8WSH9_THACA|nr:hypothetical protein AG1IA_06223 [Rhizoctonia solani AG-1 IA]
MPLAPTTKAGRLECPHHGRGRLATREEDTYVETWGCCTCYVLCTGPAHDGTDWLFWVDPFTGLGKCDDEACKCTQCDHGYGENTEVIIDATGMAYHMSGEPLVARDAKVGPYHVNVKGKHKILTRRRH